MDMFDIQRKLRAKGLYQPPLKIDGLIGPGTREGLRKFQVANGLKASGAPDAKTLELLSETSTLARPPVAVANSQPPWLTRAIALIGTLEKPGAADNQLILDMAEACGGNIAKVYKHDSIAWCKLFTEYCLVSTGFRGNDSLMALDNRRVGTSLGGPAVGALASKTRAGSPGSGHTFFVLGRDKYGRIVGVGGNQSDSVSRATFDPGVLKYNWPSGYPLPAKTGLLTLPIVESAKFSKKEA